MRRERSGGSPELSRYVQEGLKAFPATVKVVLMREHGILALGVDLTNASSCRTLPRIRRRSPLSKVTSIEPFLQGL